jgi:hypothetical protein
MDIVIFDTVLIHPTGTHAKHNEATGDNVGPLIVSVKKEE